MAAARQSLASELLQKIKRTGYNIVVPYLDINTALTARDMRRLKHLMRQSGKEVETDKFYTRKGTPKPAAIFEVFGQYCGKTGNEVRELMIDYVYKNKKEVQAEFRNALEAKKKDLPWWIVKQTSTKTPGDELTIYLLSKIFDRHSLIYTLKSPWCTFVHRVNDELSALLSKSDLVFVHTTYGFGQIRDLSEQEIASTKNVKKQQQGTKRTKSCNDTSATPTMDNILPEKAKRTKHCNNSSSATPPVIAKTTQANKT